MDVSLFSLYIPLFSPISIRVDYQDITSFGASLAPTLYYTAPATAVGNNYANITVIAIDQFGAFSAPLTVSISIAPNNAPVALNIELFATQESVSSPITLNATDVDFADAGLLQLIITSLPAKGVLIMNSMNVTTFPTVVTGPISYYTDLRGPDQFMFVAVDLLGATSATVIVPINITAVNHAPSVSFVGLGMSVLETDNVTITLITASDPDGDFVKISIYSLPSLGALYQMDGTPIMTANTTITDLLYRVIYVPPPVLADNVTSISFFGNDMMGALNSLSPIVTAVITIVHVNRPPVARNSLIVLPYGPSNFTVTANVSDLDTPIGQVAIIIQSLPDSDIVVLTDSLGIPVVVNQIVPFPFTLQVVPNVTAVGSTAFNFYATDGINVSSTFSYSIAINAAQNSPPVAIASNYTAIHGVPLAIALNVHDDDFYEWFTFKVTAQLNGAGSLTDVSTLVSYSAGTPFNISLLQNPLMYTTSAIILFTSPLQTLGQTGYLTLHFTVYDTAGAPSNTVSIVVDIAANSVPKAIFNSVINMMEEGNSSTFSLSGIDDDILITIENK